MVGAVTQTNGPVMRKVSRSKEAQPLMQFHLLKAATETFQLQSIIPNTHTWITCPTVNELPESFAQI